MEQTTEKNRKLILSDEISNASISTIIQNIIDINAYDSTQEIKYIDYERTPIELYINSGGGSVYDGLALVDVIKQSITSVYTIALGHAMSMGFWIYLAGHERLIGENATLMYHEISSGRYDKLEGLELNVKECKRLQKLYDQEIINTSHITQEQLNDYRKRKAEWYISAKEALKLGLASEIYTKYLK